MHVCFDPNVNNVNATLVGVHDLIYRVEMIRPVDYMKLTLLFMMMSIRTTHPSVHKALVPTLMDGTLMLSALKRRLAYFHELCVT